MRAKVSMRRRIRVAWLAAGLMVTIAGATAAQVERMTSPLPAPDPTYSPQEVVRIQLGALARNDEPYPDAGIEISFRFASPANRATTGPLERFVDLVKNPRFRAMINHIRADYGPALIQHGVAEVPVIIVTDDGSRIGYVFALSRQKGGNCDACWMTDSVVRFRALDPSTPRRPGAIDA